MHKTFSFLCISIDSGISAFGISGPSSKDPNYVLELPASFQLLVYCTCLQLSLERGTPVVYIRREEEDGKEFKIQLPELAVTLRMPDAWLDSLSWSRKLPRVSPVFSWKWLFTVLDSIRTSSKKCSMKFFLSSSHQTILLHYSVQRLMQHGNAVWVKPLCRDRKKQPLSYWLGGICLRRNKTVRSYPFDRCHCFHRNLVEGLTSTHGIAGYTMPQKDRVLLTELIQKFTFTSTILDGLRNQEFEDVLDCTKSQKTSRGLN